MSDNCGVTQADDVVPPQWTIGSAKDAENSGGNIIRNPNALQLSRSNKQQRAVGTTVTTRSRGDRKSSKQNKPWSQRSSNRPTSSSSSSSKSNVPITKRQVLGSLTNTDRAPSDVSLQRLRDLYLCNKEKEWFPWPDKITCLLDVMRHLPSVTLFDNQNSTITWGLKMISMSSVPSESHMKLVTVLLQQLYGIETINNKGSFGRNYYLNNMLQIISQEVANPIVRSHLEFYPDDTPGPFVNANQGDRWLRNLDAHLTTPMIRHRHQDFFLFEPCLLLDGTLCVPIRWFKRSGTLFGIACRLQPVVHKGIKAWVVSLNGQIEIHQELLDVSFPLLVESYKQRGIADPRTIIGIREYGSSEIKPWVHTDSNTGNRWRARAKGHRVLAFPMWIYCETSGKLTNGLTYNSFLFTAAGLSQDETNKPYNTHFLCTSAVADPLEMFEGISTLLKEGQRNGVWAWDCIYNEVVLLIPSVLALLGNNSVQAKMVDLINSGESLFCRICAPEQSAQESGDIVDPKEGDGTEKLSSETTEVSQNQASRFHLVGEPRSKEDTMKQLKKHFTDITSNKGESQADDINMEFIPTVSSFILASLGSLPYEDSDLNALVTDLPDNAINPVWNVQGLDAHRHNAIETVDTVLFGFVKYFWEDLLTLISDSDKNILLARLTSFNTSGLGFDRISGGRLLQHPESLTTMDYKAIVQMAPFILYDAITEHLYALWITLCNLVYLVWQPVILDVEPYLKKLNAAIHKFLSLAIQYSPNCNWLSSPEFHLILHLPQHIRNFGPVVVFSAEKYEDYNGLIQKFNIDHSCEAPSKDIARAFAYANRIRHLLSGGKIYARRDNDVQTGDQETSRSSLSAQVPQVQDFVSSGYAVTDLLERDEKLRNAYGFAQPACSARTERLVNPSTKILDPIRVWDQTLASQMIFQTTPLKMQFLPKRVEKCSSFLLQDGGKCSLDSWVISGGGRDTSSVYKVVEILRVSASKTLLSEAPIAVLLLRYHVVDVQFQPYGMPRLSNSGIYDLVKPNQILGVVNVQHNCRGNNCVADSRNDNFHEGEDVRLRKNVIQHTNPDDIILNCLQLCNHQYMQSFFSP